MMAEGLELYAKTSIMADEQFAKLNKQDQDLYITLKSSQGMDYVRNLCNEPSSMINFKTKNENGVVYFNFEIVEAVGIQYHPAVFFKVSGSVLENSTGKNVVYVIKSAKDNGTYRICMDNIINVNDNVTLNEVLGVDEKLYSWANFVSLIIKNDPSGKEKVIIIGPTSDIYKLYSSKKIDVQTLCNLALLQENIGSSSFLYEKPSTLTKRLNTNII